MFEFANGLVIFYHHLFEEFVVGWKCQRCSGVSSLMDNNCLDCNSLRPVEVTAIALVAGTFEPEQTEVTMYEFANGLVIFFHSLLEEFVAGWRCQGCNGVNSLADNICPDCDGLRPVEITPITLVAGTLEIERIGSASVN